MSGRDHLLQQRLFSLDQRREDEFDDQKTADFVLSERDEINHHRIQSFLLRTNVESRMHIAFAHVKEWIDVLEEYANIFCFIPYDGLD